MTSVDNGKYGSAIDVQLGADLLDFLFFVRTRINFTAGSAPEHVAVPSCVRRVNEKQTAGGLYQ